MLYEMSYNKRIRLILYFAGSVDKFISNKIIKKIIDKKSTKKIHILFHQYFSQ